MYSKEKLILTKKEESELVNAVDIVCDNCPYGNDVECENCNVRRFCDLDWEIRD